MQLKLLTGSLLLAAIALTSASCAGTIADEDNFDDVIGAQAELVQKKREWLTGYDRHCGVCFKAFELCKKGSADPGDATNCEAALNACVRGGLINDGDAGANVADASVNAEADAAPGTEVDAGVENVLDASDAGPRPRATRDGGVFLEDAAQSAQDRAALDGVVMSDASTSDAGIPQTLDPFADAGGRDRSGPAVGDKNQLVQNVGLCLTQIHDCLDTAASVQSCVGTLRDCVRSALAQNLANVCSTQLASCRAEGATANATRSVEKLCRQDLGFAADPE